MVRTRLAGSAGPRRDRWVGGLEESRRDVRRYRREIDQLVWAHASVEHSHYENRAGKILTLSPWPIETYWAWTTAVDPSEYELR